jgi:type I restriction enzyme S subunit
MPVGSTCQVSNKPKNHKPEARPLPPGWRWVMLKEVCSFYHGGTPSKDRADFWIGKIPWISPKDMRTDLLANSEDHISDEAVKLSATRLVSRETVLIVIRSGILARLLPVAILDREACFNQDIKAVLCDTERLIPKFLLYVLKWCEKEIIAFGVKKGATVHSIKSGYIESLEIPLPPIAEQKRIVAILNEQMAAVERARTAVRAQLDAAQALSAAYLRQAFPQAGQELPPGWRWVTLGDLISEDGQYGLSIRASEINEGIPMLRMGNINDGHIQWDDLQYLRVAKEDARSYLLEKGDLLINRTNSVELVGKSAVVDGSRDAVFASYLVRFKIDTGKGDPYFVSRFINSAAGRVFIERNMARAIGQANISASKMKMMPFPLPSLPEQKRIATLLNLQMESAGKLREVLESQLAELDALPAALLRKAFSGEL